MIKINVSAEIGEDPEGDAGGRGGRVKGEVFPATLVLGIGNLLMGDDGVGVQAVRALQQAAFDGPSLRCIDAGTLSFTLAEMIEETPRLIVVDAARMDCAPGTVRVFEGREFDRFLRGPRRSMHEVGLPDLLDMARLRGRLPGRRALVAVEPRRIEVGEALTPEAAGAVPVAIEAVREIGRRWQQASGNC